MGWQAQARRHRQHRGNVLEATCGRTQPTHAMHNAVVGMLPSERLRHCVGVAVLVKRLGHDDAVLQLGFDERAENGNRGAEPQRRLEQKRLVEASWKPFLRMGGRVWLGGDGGGRRREEGTKGREWGQRRQSKGVSMRRVGKGSLERRPGFQC